MQYIISSPTEMIFLGATLTTIGHKFLVHGDLGAGKTHLCKGFAQSLETNPDYVKSPTYVYYHEYNHKLFHGDFYRIETPDTPTLRGILDTMENYDYCFIERPRYPKYYADHNRHTIQIKHNENNPDHRTVTIEPFNRK